MPEVKGGAYGAGQSAQFTVLSQFEVSVRNGPNAARQGLDMVLSKLATVRLARDELDTVEIVLAEALNNIVEHAYAETATDNLIFVECTHLPKQLQFAIFDKGDPMPDGTIPSGKCPEIDVDFDDLPEGGFGWFLIQDLACDVEYQRFAGSNQLSLRISVA